MDPEGNRNIHDFKISIPNVPPQQQANDNCNPWMGGVHPPHFSQAQGAAGPYYSNPYVPAQSHFETASSMHHSNLSQALPPCGFDNNHHSNLSQALPPIPQQQNRAMESAYISFGNNHHSNFCPALPPIPQQPDEAMESASDSHSTDGSLLSGIDMIDTEDDEEAAVEKAKAEVS